MSASIARTESDLMPPSWKTLSLGELVVSMRKTLKLDPTASYELWSIPSHADGRPEIVKGSTIKSGKLVVEPSDVLISKINPRINRVWVVNRSRDRLPQIASTEWIVARIKNTDEISPGYLSMFASSPAFREKITEGTQGVTGSHTRAKAPQVLKIQVPVPSIEEQRRIVEILDEQLSRLDAALESVRVVREKAAQFRRSLLHAAFSGQLTSTSGSSPRAGWTVSTLNELVDSKSDIVDGPFGSNLKSAHYTESGARVIRLQNIGFGEYIDADAFISMERFKDLVKHNAREGDLLFASLGENLPRTALVPDLQGPAIVKADCIRVRLSESINRKYVLYATQRPDARKWATDQLHGMGRPRLGLGAIRDFPVPIAPVGEQQAVVMLLDDQFSRVEAALRIANGIESRASVERRSLLHAAFTGELTASWRNSR